MRKPCREVRQECIELSHTQEQEVSQMTMEAIALKLKMVALHLEI